MERIHAAVAQASRCTAEIVSRTQITPCDGQQRRLLGLGQQIGREMLGVDHVKEIRPVMGGEDFAFYGEAGTPGCFVGLGIRNEHVGSTHFVHNSRFKVDEEALPIGVGLYVEFALRSLKELGKLS